MSCGGHRRPLRCARWAALSPRFPGAPTRRAWSGWSDSPPSCSATTRRQQRLTDAARCRSETGESSCAGNRPPPRKSSRWHRARARSGTVDSSSPWDALPGQAPSSSADSGPTDWPRLARWREGQVCRSRPIASRHRRGPRCPPFSTLTARSPLPTWVSSEHRANTKPGQQSSLRRFGRHVLWLQGFRQRSACCRCRMKTVDETFEETIDRPRSECRVHCWRRACGLHAGRLGAGGVGRRRTRGQSGAERWVASARI